jgi:hypothetical protein
MAAPSRAWFRAQDGVDVDARGGERAGDPEVHQRHRDARRGAHVQGAVLHIHRVDGRAAAGSLVEVAGETAVLGAVRNAEEVDILGTRMTSGPASALAARTAPRGLQSPAAAVQAWSVASSTLVSTSRVAAAAGAARRSARRCP